METFSFSRIFTKSLFFILFLICFSPAISSGMALVFGIVMALSVGNPFLDYTRPWTPRLLQFSVVGLGAGMNLNVVGKVGIQGMGYTAAGILLTLCLGWFLGELLKLDRATALLVSVGTAICGGSAIAAVAPAIRAKPQEISVALAVVFLLNSLALFIFPGIGHYFGLSELQFGLWSALAIHDTSSVVGAALQYGPQAVEVATTVKLARALWIIPVVLAIGAGWTRLENNQDECKKSDGKAKSKPKYPWFILGFLAAAAVVTFFPQAQNAGQIVSGVAKRTLVLTLFLIGSGLSRDTVKHVGLKPIVQGLCLWLLVGSATLCSILLQWIK